MPFALLTGSPRYEPRGQWQPIRALVVASAILLVAIVASLILGYWITLTLLGFPSGGFTEEQDQLHVLISLALAFAAMAPTVWFAAGYYGDRPAEVLQLHHPLPDVRDVMGAIAGYTLVVSVCTAVRYNLNPGHFVTDYLADAGPYLTALSEFYWPLLLPLVFVLEPISSAMLFDGFLLSGLAKLRWGFWPAALFINLVACAFASSVGAAVQDFLISTYLIWLLWRSGGIRLPIICSLWGNGIHLLILTLYARS